MSFFKDVIGQEDVKQLLIHSAKNGKMPHAVLLTGPAGSGKLPVALAVHVIFFVIILQKMMRAANVIRAR